MKRDRSTRVVLVMGPLVLLVTQTASANVPIFAQTGPASPEPPNALAAAAKNKGSVSLGDDNGKGATPNWGIVPPTHTVHKGDTLWDICDHYFQNPWEWPRIWSYNPDILNPHWIYPGELVKLKKEAGEGVSYTIDDDNKSPSVLHPSSVMPGTVFLRDYGFLYDDQTEDTGELIGSPTDRMLLTPYDKVYLRITEKQAGELTSGDTMTVFQMAHAVKNGSTEVGKVVQILGTVRIDKVDKDTNLAEGTIMEALDVIERGARVGPIERRMNVVPPVTNENDVRGSVLASVHPLIVYGQNQVVLVDRGEDAGLHPGNRLTIVRHGDEWRKGLSAGGELAASDITLNTDSTATVEKKKFDTPADAPDYPEEDIAEMRVLRVRKGSAECLVTSARREIEPGDVWVARKGY